ncbi:universal stress protein [Leifsonia sp. YAF41]|uniref:universal stress protein n=1 Tax=Leifsonia sp. YAF41 TaxID=3233086 RepID=UPI003F9BE5EC
MFNQIVVAWDGSASAQTALEWALRRAGTLPVLIVNVVTGRETGSDYLSANSPTSNERVRVMEVGEQARTSHPGTPIETEVLRGSLIDELVLLSVPGTLLVVGATPRRARSTAFGWSVGTRIAGAHTRGVLAVIPEDALAETRSGIVVGVDPSAESQAVVDIARDEAVFFNEELRLVHAWTEPPDWQDVIVPELGLVENSTLEDLHQGILNDAIVHLGQGSPLTVHASLVRRLPAGALIDAAKNATELVIGNHGLRGIGRFALGSTSHAVLRDIPAPTLVVRS